MDVKPPVIANGETQGLSDSVAAERLEKEGPNELPAAKPKSALAIAAEVVSEPMFLLLIATGTVYLVRASDKLHNVGSGKSGSNMDESVPHPHNPGTAGFTQYRSVGNHSGNHPLPWLHAIRALGAKPVSILDTASQ